MRDLNSENLTQKLEQGAPCAMDGGGGCTEKGVAAGICICREAAARLREQDARINKLESENYEQFCGLNTMSQRIAELEDALAQVTNIAAKRMDRILNLKHSTFTVKSP